MSRKKKMKQELVDKNVLSELFGLYIILIKQDSKHENIDIEEIKKQYELLIALDPKYPENIIPLKQAMLKVESSDIVFSSKYNISSFY